MEGLCRASSSHSIADSPLLFNAKCHKTGGFSRFRTGFAPSKYDLSTSVRQGCDGIAGPDDADAVARRRSRFSEKRTSMRSAAA